MVLSLLLLLVMMDVLMIIDSAMFTVVVGLPIYLLFFWGGGGVKGKQARRGRDGDVAVVDVVVAFADESADGY